MSRLVIIMNPDRVLAGEPPDHELINLEPGDTIVINGIGPALHGEEALRFEIDQLEARLDKCHELLDALFNLAGRVAAASTMTQVSDALAEYAGVADLPRYSDSRWRAVRRLWNTPRRRPPGQA